VDGTMASSVLRALFSAALAPYHAHMRHWLFTQQPVEPLFSIVVPSRENSTPTPGSDTTPSASPSALLPTTAPATHTTITQAGGAQEQQAATVCDTTHARSHSRARVRKHTHMCQQGQHNNDTHGAGGRMVGLQASVQGAAAQAAGPSVASLAHHHTKHLQITHQPGQLPSFLSHVAREFHVAGQQQRLLGKLGSCVGA